MNFLISILIGCVGYVSFGQDAMLSEINIEQLNTDIELLDQKYAIAYVEIIPSLSFIPNTNYRNSHTLMIIDLSVDLRTQHLRSKRPTLQIAENKFVQSDFNMTVLSPKQRNSAFTITNNARNNYKNSSSRTLKNTAYQDMSFTPTYFCPITYDPVFISN